MRHAVSLLVLVSVLSCGTERAAAPGPVAAAVDSPLLKSAELARVRCLVVAPFENGSDAPLAGEAATAALVSEVDAARTRVFPVSDLRALFRDTPLELPSGFGPSLALELAELLAADAVLYGSVEGHSRDGAPELLVTIRLALTADHRLLFAQTVLVTPATDERTESAVRRAVLRAARPALARLGDAARKRCFDPERTKELRKVALAQSAEARPGGRLALPSPAPKPPGPTAAVPAPSSSAPAQPARAIPRTPRQADWAKRLDAGERFVVDDVVFAGRSAELERETGLADLAMALLAQPAVNVRLEGFVDTTTDHSNDHKLSLSMAQAMAQRLADLGVQSSRVAWAGRGGESPRLPNFTIRGRAANRRIEVVVVR